MSRPAEADAAPRGMDGDLAGLRALHRDAERLSRRLAAGQRAAGGVAAWDPAGAVRVTLDGDGRIAAVELAATAPRRLGADALGPAVLAAYEQAALARWRAWAAALSDEPAEPAADAPDEPPPAAAGPDPTDAGPVDFSRRLFRAVRDATAGLDELADDAARLAGSVVTAEDRDGRARVTLTGQSVTAVDVDGGWLRHARRDEVAAAVTAAVRAGYAAADEQLARSRRRRWPYDELDRLTADPARLLADLGLPVPPAPRPPREEN